MEKSKGVQTNELNYIVQTLIIIKRVFIGETLFIITYGIEAVTLVEIGAKLVRVQYLQETQNREQVRIELELIEKVKEKAKVRCEEYKRKAAKITKLGSNPNTSKRRHGIEKNKSK